MTQRVWIVAFTCGLSAGLVSGCTLTHGHKDESVIARDDAKPPPDPPPSHYLTIIDDKGQPSAGSEKSSDTQQMSYSDEGPHGDAALPVDHVPNDSTQFSSHRPELVQPFSLLAADSGKQLPEEHVVIALHDFLAKNLPDAVRHLEHYDKDNQEALLLLLPLVALFAEDDLNHAKPQDIEKFLDQIEGLARMLRPRASLTLGQVRFCRNVHGFGMIDPLPDDYTFQCGSGGRLGEGIILYVEVNHTASRPKGPYYETSLAGRLEILDANGKQVWSNEFPDRPNSSISPRHDYFVIFHFSVPAHLPPGPYWLALELSDRTWRGRVDTPAHRIAQRKLPFEVGSGDGSRIADRPSAGIQAVGGGVR
jgi:hypothetical protein